jgi:serine/threonine-protein kinase
MTSEPSFVGRVVDERYRIDAQIGEGGMGIVYRAEHLRLNRPVALKVLQQEYVDNDDIKMRFDRECRALAALSHPNIVSITDYGVVDQTPYLVMELLEGDTLHHRLRHGGLPPERAIAIARQMLRALAHAHRQGMVHRDFKPGNIFLRPLPDDTDHVTILDFGLVRFVAGTAEGDRAQLTNVGTMLGTPAYMAPEQAAGESTDARTDVYAAGVVIFEMLTGQKPFSGDPGEILRHHLLSPVPRLASIGKDLLETAEMDALLGRALAKEQKLRFAHAGELLDALEGVKLPVIAPGAAPRARPPTELGTMPTMHAGDLARAATDAARPPARTEAATVASGRAATHRTPAPPGPAAPTPTSTLHLRPSPIDARKKPLLIGAGVTLALGLGLVVMTSGGPSDEPAEDATDVTATDPRPAPAGETEVPDEAPAEAPEALDALDAPTEAAAPDAPIASANTVSAPKPAAEDPWAGGVPRGLSRAKRAVDSGRPVSERFDRGLIRAARTSPTDPRPDLLLAGAFVSRGWRSDAVERYELAYNRSAASRGDRRMRHDLVMLSADGAAGVKAARAVRRIYGREALEEIDRQLGAGGFGRDERARLLRLRAAIEDGG